MKLVKVDDMFYGNFIEHMGRALYNGIYNLNYKDIDRGFRNDITEEYKNLNISIIRYPGGNFVSGYNWRDGIGLKEHRPIRTELAWNSIETNEVGTDEFLRWAKENKFEPMMCVNLGTGTEKEAAELVEYCNITEGTTISNLRKQNGMEKPYNVKYWCLGNEMDGPWQIMHCSAEDYAKKAREAAKMMKWVDPSIKLIACGSSQCELPSYPTWDRVVLEELYPYVDYISAHRYYNQNESFQTEESFLYSYVDLNNYIDTIRAVITYCKNLHRTNKQVYISFDEWNVVNSKKWLERKREIAPKESESENTFLDALVMGDMLICMLKNADIIKITCQSMLVNVGAPIMIDDSGEIYYQTIYYPFKDVYAQKPEYVIDIPLKVDKVVTSKFGEVDVVNYVLTKVKDEYILYAVNHSEVEQNIEPIIVNNKDIIPYQQKELISDDLYMTNTYEKANVVESKYKTIDKIVLKPYSWNKINLKEKI